jgi:hypothetical protein
LGSRVPSYIISDGSF